MREPAETVRADSTVREVFEARKGSELHAWPVQDGDRLIGMTSLAALQRAIAGGDESKRLRDLVEGSDLPHVHADHPLDLALERMGAAKLDVLPVVSRADTRQILGIVVLSDILKAFGIDRSEPADLAG